MIKVFSKNAIDRISISGERYREGWYVVRNEKKRPHLDNSLWLYYTFDGMPIYIKSTIAGLDYYLMYLVPTNNILEEVKAFRIEWKNYTPVFVDFRHGNYYTAHELTKAIEDDHKAIGTKKREV